MWQKVWNTAYTRLKRLKWKQKEKKKKKEGVEQQTEEDTQMHNDSSAATGTADSTGLSNGAATMQQNQAAVSILYSLCVILEDMYPYTLRRCGLPEA